MEAFEVAGSTSTSSQISSKILGIYSFPMSSQPIVADPVITAPLLPEAPENPDPLTTISVSGQDYDTPCPQVRITELKLRKLTKEPG